MLAAEVPRTETITNGSKLTCGDMGQSNEENSLLLSNSSTVLYNNSASSSDEGEEAMKLYNSMDSNLSFHCHDGDNSSIEETKDNSRNAKRKLIIACVLVLLFICLEVAGGIASKSLAIIADAAHMLSDFFSLGISLGAIYLSERPMVKKYTFGYKRAEVIGALLIIIIIWIVTGILLYLAIHRLRSGDYEVECDYMMIVAACAVAFNIVLGLVLHGICKVPHSHSHGGHHSHNKHLKRGHKHLTSRSKLHSESDSDIDDDVEESKEYKKQNRNDQHINIRAALIHVLGDFLQSVGVLISSIIIKFEPTYKWADPLCTVLFSVIVFFTTLTIARDTIHILVEGYPKNIANYDRIYNSLLSIHNVVQVHGLKIWSLTVNHTELICHLGISPSYKQNLMDVYNSVLEDATQMLRKKYDIQVCTIQIEIFKKEISQSCHGCQPLKQ